ncbi:ERMES complex subunit mmm1 [Cladochytrium tenue]|nr:ERMES complex subunit mmm1 [Cladochytrium tenue]
MSSSNLALEAAVNLASKEFIKGFIAGQIILCILLFFLVTVFLLRNGEETRIEMTRRKRAMWQPKENRPPLRQHALDSHVLLKTGYEPGVHPFESCDWINVVLGQVIARYRSDPLFSAGVVASLDSMINGKSRPGFLAPITITDFSLGEEFPRFEAARMQYAELTSNLVFKH